MQVMRRQRQRSLTLSLSLSLTRLAQQQMRLAVCRGDARGGRIVGNLVTRVRSRLSVLHCGGMSVALRFEKIFEIHLHIRTFWRILTVK